MSDTPVIELDEGGEMRDSKRIEEARLMIVRSWWCMMAIYVCVCVCVCVCVSVFAVDEAAGFCANGDG